MLRELTPPGVCRLSNEAGAVGSNVLFSTTPDVQGIYKTLLDAGEVPTKFLIYFGAMCFVHCRLLCN
jgi:hypothetical protein